MTVDQSRDLLLSEDIFVPLKEKERHQKDHLDHTIKPWMVDLGAAIEVYFSIKALCYLCHGSKPAKIIIKIPKIENPIESKSVNNTIKR